MKDFFLWEIAAKFFADSTGPIRSFIPEAKMNSYKQPPKNTAKVTWQ